MQASTSVSGSSSTPHLRWYFFATSTSQISDALERYTLVARVFRGLAQLIYDNPRVGSRVAHTQIDNIRPCWRLASFRAFIFETGTAEAALSLARFNLKFAHKSISKSKTAFNTIGIVYTHRTDFSKFFCAFLSFPRRREPGFQIPNPKSKIACRI